MARAKKPPRDALLTRPPLAVGEVVRVRAAEQGYESISDYIAAVLAVHEGMPSLAPQPTAPPQMEVLELGA